MNIIYNFDSNNLRVKKDGGASLNFYIPKTIKVPIYCKIKNSRGQMDILSLTKAFEDKMYSIYKISNKNALTVSGNEVDLSLFFFTEDGAVIVSDEVKNIELQLDDLEAMLNISLLQNVNAEIKELYSKIVELTKMNIDIYSNIKEVTEK